MNILGYCRVYIHMDVILDYAGEVSNGLPRVYVVGEGKAVMSLFDGAPVGCPHSA